MNAIPSVVRLGDTTVIRNNIVSFIEVQLNFLGDNSVSKNIKNKIAYSSKAFWRKANYQINIYVLFKLNKFI